MRLAWSIFTVACFVPEVFAAVTVSTVGTTQQQAVLKISGANGHCTLEISESDTFAPPIPDADPTKYSASNIDVSRLDTISYSNGDRILTIGHTIDDRSLAPDTIYYLRVSDCGTQTYTFKTARAAIGYTQGYPIPVNRNKWGNRGNQPTPTQLINKETIPDAVTGIKVTPGNGLEDVTWVHPKGPAYAPSATFQFKHWDGGSGWTNAASILNGSTSKASTATGNPLDVYIGAEASNQFEDAWYFNTLTNFAVKVFGGGANVTFCIFANPLDGCPTRSGFTVTMPNGSGMAHVASASTDVDHPWPAGFPKALFGGWNLDDKPITAHNRLTHGTLSAAAGLITLDGSLTGINNISAATKHGAKIYIAGSSRFSPSCTNDLCTIDKVITANQAQLVETINAPTATPYEIPGFGIRILNAEALSGKTLQIGVEWKASGNVNVGVSNSSNAQCGAGDGFTSGHKQPKKVKLCSVPANGMDFWYLIAEDGWSTIFKTSNDMPPVSYFTDQLGWPIAEAPSDKIGGWCCGQVSYAAFDARAWYVNAPNRAGGSSLYLVTYMGDATEPRIFDYRALVAGDAFALYGIEGSGANATFNKEKWQIIVGSANDVATQIRANHPEYDEAFYGMGFRFNGVSGTHAYYLNQYSGMPQDGPSWIAIADINTGHLTSLIHTMDATGLYKDGDLFVGGAFGGVHNLSPLPDLPDTAWVSVHSMFQNNPAVKFGGPFQITPDAIMRGGQWSSNTCLGWPLDDQTHCPGVPAPDADCERLAPGNPFVFAGATGNACIAIRVPQGGLCNIAPNAAELAHPGWTCPWNSGYSRPFPTRVGNILMEASAQGIWDEDFRIVAIYSGTEAGGKDKWILQRNATSEYECVAPGPIPGSRCLMTTKQAYHDNGFSLLVNAAGINGWAAPTWLIHNTGDVPSVQIAVGNAASGHPTSTQLAPGLYVFASSAGALPPKPLDHLFDIPLTEYVFSQPAFHGASVSAGNNSVQSYFTAVPDSPTSLDYHTLNNNGGWAHPPIGGGRDLIRTPTPNVYKIELIGNTTVDPRFFHYYGWAGSFLLEDVSSAATSSSGPVAALQTPYTFCRPLRNSECYADSQASAGGTHGRPLVYVNVPAVYDAQFEGGSYCFADVPYLNIPCVLIGWPGVGAGREQGITKDDPSGSNTRILSYMMDIPGEARAYVAFEAIMHSLAWAAPTRVAGLVNTSALVQRPEWYEGTSVANDVILTDLEVPAGPAYADVQFGYSRFIGPNGDPGSAQCHTRKEKCHVVGTTYNWAGDQGQNYRNDCARGCKFQVPLQAPNVAYAKVRRSTDGVTWTDGEIIPLVESGVRESTCSELRFNPASITPPIGGGSSTVTARIPAGCNFSVHSDATWVAIAGASGDCTISGSDANCTQTSGTGTITWTATSNPGIQRWARLKPSSGPAVTTVIQNGARSRPVSGK